MNPKKRFCTKPPCYVVVNWLSYISDAKGKPSYAYTKAYSLIEIFFGNEENAKRYVKANS